MHPAESWMLPSWSTLQEEEMGRVWEWEVGQDLSKHGEMKSRCGAAWSCIYEGCSLPAPWVPPNLTDTLRIDEQLP